MAPAPDITASGAGAIRPGSARGAAGFFRVAQLVTGQWWLFDSGGRPVFLRAVNGVRNAESDTDPSPDRDPAVRLRTWGFNAVGFGGDGAGREDGWPYLASVDFCRVGTLITAPGIRLPDVFAPDWAQLTATRASGICAPLAEATDLVAWAGDDDLAWGESSATRPGLLQVCLSLEPSFAAYHAAWEFVLALHGGRLAALATAWGVDLPNKEVVREMTRSEIGIVTRGALRDDVRWTREFARRYFATTSSAIRAVDRHHIVCGARSRLPAGAAVTAIAMLEVDVSLLHWTEIGVAAVAGGAILADGVGWADPAFRAAGAASDKPSSRAGKLTSVERMLRRARAALRRLARHPCVTGYLWSRWYDEPGEQPPFAGGLVHGNEAEAREQTELLTEFNGRAEALRRGAARQLSP